MLNMHIIFFPSAICSGARAESLLMYFVATLRLAPGCADQSTRKSGGDKTGGSAKEKTKMNNVIEPTIGIRKDGICFKNRNKNRSVMFLINDSPGVIGNNSPKQLQFPVSPFINWNMRNAENIPRTNIAAIRIFLNWRLAISRSPSISSMLMMSRAAIVLKLNETICSKIYNSKASIESNFATAENINIAPMKHRSACSNIIRLFVTI